MLGGMQGQVNERRGLGSVSKESLAKNPGSLTDPVLSFASGALIGKAGH
jgi:hypothetical protein